MLRNVCFVRTDNVKKVGMVELVHANKKFGRWYCQGENVGMVLSGLFGEKKNIQVGINRVLLLVHLIEKRTLLSPDWKKGRN